MTRVPRSHLPAEFLEWLESTMSAGRYEHVAADRLEALAHAYRLWVDPDLPPVFDASDGQGESG